MEGWGIKLDGSFTRFASSQNQNVCKFQRIGTFAKLQPIITVTDFIIRIYVTIITHYLIHVGKISLRKD